MIRKLRRQFNRITILMLILVLLIPLIGVNLLTRFVSYQQTDTRFSKLQKAAATDSRKQNRLLSRHKRIRRNQPIPLHRPTMTKKKSPLPPLRQTINSLNETINVPLMCSMILPSI